MEQLCDCMDELCDKIHTTEATNRFLELKEQKKQQVFCLHTEWISSVGDTIVCAMCGKEKDDDMPKLPDHQSDCVCNQCMTDEEYQEYLTKKNITLKKWIPRCPECKVGLSFMVTYPVVEIKNNKESENWGLAYCTQCKKDFDPFWDVQGTDNIDTKPVTSTTPKINYPVVYASCTHKPTHAINGETWHVYVGKRTDCIEHLNDYDIILNLTGYSVDTSKHTIPIKELAKYRGKTQTNYKEIVLNWPDMGVVDLKRDFWEDLVKYLQKEKAKMLLFCMGGHGRTGTAYASLLVVGCEYTPADAVKWVRNKYCEDAIETWKQVNYVYQLNGEAAPESKERKDFTYTKPPCSSNCVCMECLTNEEYAEYRKTNVYPTNRKKDQKEQKSLEVKQEVKQNVKPSMQHGLECTCDECSEEDNFLRGWHGHF